MSIIPEMVFWSPCDEKYESGLDMNCIRYGCHRVELADFAQALTYGRDLLANIRPLCCPTPLTPVTLISAPTPAILCIDKNVLAS